MTTGSNLRTYILNSTAIADLVGTQVYQNNVPVGVALPFVWFRRRGVEYLEILGEAETVPYREFYDVESVAESLNEADSIADAVRTRLHGASGTLGSTDAVYQWVGVQDQADDYVPRNMQADELLQIVSLDIEVINQ
jgi:hypothetical protein